MDLLIPEVREENGGRRSVIIEACVGVGDIAVLTGAVRDLHRAHPGRIVDIPVAVDVKQKLTSRMRHEYRFAPDPVKRAGRRIHSSWNELLGFCKGGLAIVSFGNGLGHG